MSGETTTTVTAGSTTVAGRQLARRTTPFDHVSTYIDDDYYDLLRRDAAEWEAPGRPLDAAEAETYGALLLHEAWLIDRQRYEDWLDLYTDDCVYWVPAGVGVPDPQRNVTIAFDDRRRLLDRIGWLRTDLAYAQLPPSRTAHQVTGSVVVPTAEPGEVKVRSSLVVHERRVGPVRAVAGWCGHVLRETGDGLRIARKVVSVIDSDSAQHNLTFLL